MARSSSDGEVALGPAGHDLAEQLGERLGGDGAGRASSAISASSLIIRRLLDDMAERDQVRAARQRGERGVPLDGHLLRLEGQRPAAALGGEPGQGRLDLPLGGDLDVGAVALGRLGVAGVGGQHARPVGREQHRRVGADQPGEVADVGRRW